MCFPCSSRCWHVCKLPGRVLGIRVLRFSLVAVLLLLLVAGSLTTFLPSNKDDKMLMLRREVKAQGQSTLASFTLIMQTYNRSDLLLRLLNHYQAVPQLHRVIVVWNNVGEKPPEDLWNSLGPHPVPVVFKPQTTNRMRNRLQAFPELETPGELQLGSLSGRAAATQSWEPDVGAWPPAYLHCLEKMREI